MSRTAHPFHSLPFTNSDLIDLILGDHDALKGLTKIMKDKSLDLNERLTAFEQFAPLFVTHSIPEEKVLYGFLKREDDDNLREEGFEGEVEHVLADQLLEEVKRADNDEVLSAKLKVLAELVEHHIEEEEAHILPDFKENTESQEREEMGAIFLHLKTRIQSEGSNDAPTESEIAERHPTYF